MCTPHNLLDPSAVAVFAAGVLAADAVVVADEFPNRAGESVGLLGRIGHTVEAVGVAAAHEVVSVDHRNPQQHQKAEKNSMRMP